MEGPYTPGTSLPAHDMMSRNEVETEAVDLAIWQAIITSATEDGVREKGEK